MSVAGSLNSAMLGPPSRPDDLKLLRRPNGKDAQAEKAKKLHDTFTQFVGQTFYGQMIKSMRSTVKPAAYFNGGQGEKIFQGQLDQTLADQMTKASADRFAEPMLRQQFPNLDPQAGRLTTAKQTSNLNDLNQLARR
jgi:Rod binding domain-containing protein